MSIGTIAIWILACVAAVGLLTGKPRAFATAAATACAALSVVPAFLWGEWEVLPLVFAAPAVAVVGILLSGTRPRIPLLALVAAAAVYFGGIAEAYETLPHLLASIGAGLAVALAAAAFGCDACATAAGVALGYGIGDLLRCVTEQVRYTVALDPLGGGIALDIAGIALLCAPLLAAAVRAAIRAVRRARGAKKMPAASGSQRDEK